MLTLAGDNSFYACLLSFMFNLAVYPVFIMFLASETVISKPLIDIKAGITENCNLKNTVISRSKMIARNSFLWFFLCCLPFVFYSLTQKNLLEQISPITILVIANGVLAIICLLVLSTILLLYYKRVFSVLLSISVIVFSTFNALAPQTELSLLFLFMAIITLTYFSSYLLIHKRKRLENVNSQT
jgi:hypothetical protein